MSVPTISPQALAELCRGDRKIDLIDVRTPVEYREAHVAAARNVPLDRLDPAAGMRSRNGSGGGALDVLCPSGSPGRPAGGKFLGRRVTHRAHLGGGPPGLVGSGPPVGRGKKAISLERQVRIAAGLLVLLGAVLGWLVHPAFVGLSAFVGAGLVFAGVTDTCGMGMMLARMPWNRVQDAPTGCRATQE